MIYADNAATTKMSKTAIAAMLPYMEEQYGNPSSLYALQHALVQNRRRFISLPAAVKRTTRQFSVRHASENARARSTLFPQPLNIMLCFTHWIS